MKKYNFHIILVSFFCNIITANFIWSNKANYTINYKKLFSESLERKPNDNFIIVNDTNCHINITLNLKYYMHINDSDGKTYASDNKTILEPGGHVLLRTIVRGVRKTLTFDGRTFQNIWANRVEIIATDSCKNKKEICKNSNEKALYIYKILKYNQNKILFIRRKREKGWEPKKNKLFINVVTTGQPGNCTADKTAFIERIRTSSIQNETKGFVVNDTTANHKGFLEYEIEQKGTKNLYKGILNNGGNEREIFVDNNADIKKSILKYYEQRNDGVYSYKKKKKFGKVDIKKNKINKLLYKYNPLKEIWSFKIKRERAK